MLSACLVAWLVSLPQSVAPSPRHSMLGRDRPARPPGPAEAEWERAVRRDIERILEAGGDPFY
jgi:hypothetical protein